MRSESFCRDYRPGGDEARDKEVIQMDNMDWHSVAVEGRRKLSGDAPFQLNKARIERSVLFGKVARTGDTWEKQLDAELPWTAIDPQDRPELKVEDKQWKEHIQFSAVRALAGPLAAANRRELPAHVREDFVQLRRLTGNVALPSQREFQQRRGDGALCSDSEQP
ncbi:hypothetical protein AK812_SmicGene39247 [Symbiodinium microadriaticum]|uniref:Uncharacterized protein n=1 Tax=Symbiodinium microadriaticum TaxID=2951 RepID=A0A1Q9CBR9_SYMMI|nr:hypothetical protein AK812_SmicGene39247 [Symbiodinium microadriaticum]